MSKINFVEKLKGMKKTKFEWISLERQTSINNDDTLFEYVTFELKEPIERVTSSHQLVNPSNPTERKSRSIVDVVFLNISMEDLAKFEADFHPDVDENEELTGTGKYEGNLEVDLAKTGDKVWLTPVKLAKKAQLFRGEKEQQTYNKLFGTANDIMDKLGRGEKE